MNNNSAATSVLRFSLFLKNNGDKVRTLHTGKLRRIYAALENYEWDTAEVFIRYLVGGQEIGENSGVYHSTDEVKMALAAWTEQENREYILGGAS